MQQWNCMPECNENSDCNEIKSAKTINVVNVTLFSKTLIAMTIIQGQRLMHKPLNCETATAI